MAKSVRVKTAISKRTERNCLTGICNPKRTQGLKVNPKKGKYTLVSIKGPGVFLAAHVTKQGGTNGLTFVNLHIDGKNVTSLSYVAAQNWGLTQQNPYGIVLLKGGIVDNFTVGFPSPLRFERELQLSVQVNELNVVQIVGNVIAGST